MKTILVPTDFSVQAQNAVQVAAHIAAKSGGSIHLLHVMDVSMGGSFSTMGEVHDYSMDNLFVVRLMELNKKRLHQIADQLSTAGITGVTYDIQVGNIVGTIIDQVEAHVYDLVVMGTKGASGLDGLLVGSNTEKIVRFSPVPVLSVKEVTDSFKLQKIVFASNFEADQLPAVSKIKRFQELFGAFVHLVYINVPNQFANSRVIRQRMDDFVQRYQLQDYDFTIYNDDSEEKGIIHFAEEADADLIAVATHGRTGLAHLLSGSIAEGIVNHGTRPVLTVNLKRLDK